ncbi:MAG TPA: enoyl-CoA hydratase [Bacillota bacterium]|nr:enoyl-CoA hydratase [Bacillota bacterium]
MSQVVTYEFISDKIALITLNRPKAANALSLQLLDELNNILNHLKTNESIVCTILTGVGQKVFCAGADLKERETMNEKEALETVKMIGQTITNVAELPMPTIAALNGAAFGGGLELALACDLRVAQENISLGLTETALAIIPGAGGTQRLARLIGVGQAKRLIYTAARISGKEAFDIGIVEYLAENAVEQALTIAKQMTANGPIALRQAKLAIDHGLQTDLETGLMIEHLAYQQTLTTEDRLEGLQAFKEKRQPNYNGQ